MRSDPIDPTSDAELVASARAGELAAFERLARRYLGLAFALAYHQLGRFEDAEDAAQEALVEAYLKLHHLREPERFAGWLRRIVAGKAAELARRRREEPLPPEGIEAEQARNEPPPSALEAEVQEALAQLPPPVRLATTLFYGEDLSYREIADLLAVPVSTVRGRLQRARSFLRSELIDRVAAGLRTARPGEAFVERLMSKIQSIQVYQSANEQGPKLSLLHLTNDQGRRLNNHVGLSEAIQIQFQLQGEATPRPLTFQLVTTILASFGLRTTRAEVTELKDNTFHALLTVEGNGQVLVFDARPSDAISLALAAGAEIHVDDQVLDAVGVIEEPGPDLAPFTLHPMLRVAPPAEKESG